MNKLYFSITALLVAGGLSVNAQTTKKNAPAKKGKNAKAVVAAKPVLNGTDSASYSFGFKIAQGLKSDGVISLNYDLLAKAMQDVFKGDSTLLTDEQSSVAISKFLEAVNKAKFASSIEEGTKFLEENKKRPEVTTLASGLQYEVITAGTGAKPKAEDEVTVHYKGTLINGKQFDSSYDRGEPISLQLNRVIPGWTEGVQLMPVGSKYRLFVPYALGYGERGAGGEIPGYSTLIFDIELIKIGK